MATQAERGVTPPIEALDAEKPELRKSILDLPQIIESELSPSGREVFFRIHDKPTISESPICYSSPGALSHVAGRFRAEESQLTKRAALRVTNIVLDEETLFSPLRVNRPLQSATNNNVSESIEKSRGDCDLCAYADRTPYDEFGRIEGKYCVTAANAGAYDGIHSLVVPRDEHSALAITEELLVDMINTGNRWFEQASAFYQEQDARYPFMILNMLPRAGASLPHAHLQVLLATEKPYQKMEDARRRMKDYQEYNHYLYLNDLAYSLRSLGLVKDVGSAHIIFHLTPRKEKEVIIYEDDGSGLPNGDLTRAVYKVIEWWRDEFGATSFNMAVYMPPIGEDIKRDGKWKGFFPYVRLVERGREGTATSDIGAMEFYGPAVVSGDPFILSEAFSQYLRKNLTQR